jgi:hypothetical protein
VSVSLLALLALAGLDQPSQKTTTFKLLVIELPDGERGGFGRIQGTGSFADARGRLDFMQLARTCGAHHPMLSNNWSHSTHIISWSAPNDREVVECLKGKLPTHFNAGVAEPDVRLGFTAPDAAMFRDLETPREPTRKKRN